MSSGKKRSKTPTEKKPKRSEREVTLSLWSTDSPGIHIFYNPYYKTASVDDNDAYWGHLGVNRHYEHLRNKGDMVQFEGFPEAIPKKNIHFPERVIKNTQRYIESGFDTVLRGCLEPIKSLEHGFGAPVKPKYWHALVNLLQYDENEGDIWGDRRYPCGVNLPGSYFDREEMMKEVTFIAISTKETSDTNEPELEELEDYIKTRAAIHTHNQNKHDDLMDKYSEYFNDKPSMKKSFLKKIAKIREKAVLGKVGKKDNYNLTGFLVVKDINYKPMKQWNEERGDVYTPMAKSEPFLYVEGLCSNVRGGGSLLLDLANIMGHEMGYMGTKLSALTMVISYYFAKFNFRHYTGTFTRSTGSRDYMPIPIAIDSELGKAWEQYLMRFMTRGSAVQERWKTQSKQDVDIEHFHRDNSEGIWRDIIGALGHDGKYPHINAGSPWSYRTRHKSIDENMGDMGYYMYFVYGSEYPLLTNYSNFTPTTQFIMGMGMPQPVAMPQEDPTCMEKCRKKGGKTCEKICGFFGSKYKKEGGRSRRRRRKRTRKRRKYKKKRTRKRRRKYKRSRKK